MSAPAYASVPLPPDIHVLSAANTNRDGTGTLVQLAAGPAGGARACDVIEQVFIHAIAATTAGMIRFFLSADGGTNKRLIAEVPVELVTPGVAAPAFRALGDDLVGLVLSSDQVVLYGSTHNAETFNVFVQKAGVPA